MPPKSRPRTTKGDIAKYQRPVGYQFGGKYYKEKVSKRGLLAHQQMARALNGTLIRGPNGKPMILCHMCRAHTLYTATEADHEPPLHATPGNTKRSPTQLLCKTCHAQKTNAERRARAKQPMITPGQWMTKKRKR